MSLPPARHAYQTGVFWLILESLSGAHGRETRGRGALWTLYSSAGEWVFLELFQPSFVPLPLCGSSRPRSPELFFNSNSCWGFPADENESQTCLHIQRGLLTKYVDFFPGSLQQKSECFLNNNDFPLFHHVFLIRAPRHCILSLVHLWKGETKEHEYFLERLTIIFGLGLALSLLASQDSPQSKAYNGWHCFSQCQNCPYQMPR